MPVRMSVSLLMYTCTSRGRKPSTLMVASSRSRSEMLVFESVNTTVNASAAARTMTT